MTKKGVVDWWVSVHGAPTGQHSDIFQGWHVANEIATPQVCINSNNSSNDCKKLQPEIEINEYSSSKKLLE